MELDKCFEDAMKFIESQKNEYCKGMLYTGNSEWYFSESIFKRNWFTVELELEDLYYTGELSDETIKVLNNNLNAIVSCDYDNLENLSEYLDKEVRESIIKNFDFKGANLYIEGMIDAVGILNNSRAYNFEVCLDISDKRFISIKFLNKVKLGRVPQLNNFDSSYLFEDYDIFNEMGLIEELEND